MIEGRTNSQPVCGADEGKMRSLWVDGRQILVGADGLCTVSEAGGDSACRSLTAHRIPRGEGLPAQNEDTRRDVLVDGQDSAARDSC